MPIIKTLMNTTILTTVIIHNKIDATGILEPLVRDLVRPVFNELIVPAVKQIGGGAALGLTCASASHRATLALLEYQRPGSLRNPKFWGRTAAFACTGTSLVLQAYGVSPIGGGSAQWALHAGQSLEAFVQTIEKKFDPANVVF